MLTKEFASSQLAYNPETGEFRSHEGVLRGGKDTNGYWRISVGGKQLFAHRLAFLLMTGEWPNRVDHINGDRADNRWSNLRNGTNTINQQNLRRAQKNNRSGLLGVMHHKNHSPQWSARIYHSGRSHHLGYFDDPNKAHQRYLEEKRRVHPGCTI